MPYLLIFWNKTVGSLSSVKHETELHIEAITVNLTGAYLKSCLECVHAVMDGEADGKPNVTLAATLAYFYIEDSI